MKKNRGILSRADLLSCLEKHGESRLSAFASVIGFEKALGEAPSPSKKRETSLGEMKQTVAEEKQVHHFPKSSGKKFWRVVAHQFKEYEKAGSQPDWVNTTEPITSADEAAIASRLCSKSPLVPWSRLWPFLRRALGDKKQGKKVDIDMLTGLMARGENFHKFPYQEKKSWAQQCQILVDCSDRNQPFWGDFESLILQLEQMRGKSGLQVLQLEEGPDADCRPWGQWQEPNQNYQKPTAGTPLLILGDLGCYDPTGITQKKWIAFGKKLQKSGLKPIALMVCPPRLWTESLAEFFHLVCWDRAQKLPLKSELLPKSQRLLSLLSPAIRVEPELLRSIRQLLPAQELDVGCEGEVWMHPDIYSTPIAIAFKENKIEFYRTQFLQEETHLQKKVLSLINRFHQHLPVCIGYEEKLIASNLTQVPDSSTEHYFRKIFKSIEAGHRGIAPWMMRSGLRQHPAMWNHSEALSASWLSVYKEALRKGQIKLPSGFELDRVAWVFAEKMDARQFLLVQEGEQIKIFPKEMKETQTIDNGFVVTMPLAELTLHNPFIQIQTSDPKLGENFSQPINWSRSTAIPFPAKGPLILKTESDCVTLEANQKTDWADKVGQDQIGFYAEFSFKGVVQRMRWISPGKIMMGSPENESERSKNEQQHEVILTRGYWLADTACTQALWQAVMGKNPSKFHGETLPVETVSWKDTQKFIHQLNQEKDELNLRLPSEAEWEYACRAGTQSAFSFGGNITPEQVNYNGKYPYADVEKGINRAKTVPVRSLPQNQWGLFEMHGNVWEWCSDWFADYQLDESTDPIGPDEGAFRVLRGGSWFHYGRDVRSAYRNHHVPVRRLNFIGFRLARGH